MILKDVVLVCKQSWLWFEAALMSYLIITNYESNRREINENLDFAVTHTQRLNLKQFFETEKQN